MDRSDNKKIIWSFSFGNLRNRPRSGMSKEQANELKILFKLRIFTSPEYRIPLLVATCHSKGKSVADKASTAVEEATIGDHSITLFHLWTSSLRHCWILHVHKSALFDPLNTSFGRIKTDSLWNRPLRAQKSLHSKEMMQLNGMKTGSKQKERKRKNIIWFFTLQDQETSQGKQDWRAFSFLLLKNTK